MLIRQLQLCDKLLHLDHCYVLGFFFFPPFYNSKKESKQTGTRSVGPALWEMMFSGFFGGECSRFPTSTDRLLIWREPVLLLWCGTLCREGDTCRRVPFDPAGKGRKLECWGKSSGAGATAARPSGRLSRVSFSAVSVGIIISL